MLFDQYLTVSIFIEWYRQKFVDMELANNLGLGQDLLPKPLEASALDVNLC